MGSSGLLKILLIQGYESYTLLWIHNIDAICIVYKSIFPVATKVIAQKLYVFAITEMIFPSF